MTTTPRRLRRDPPADPDNPGDVSWWNELVILHAIVEQELVTVLRRHALAPSEYRALALLARSPKVELRILDLADALRLNQSSVSRLVGRLEAAGLVHRQTCGDDRRGVFTVLTPAGTRVLTELTPVYVQTLTAAITRAAASSPAVAAIVSSMRDTRVCPGSG